MNKSELITSMAEKAKMTKKDAEIALKAFTESVEEALEKGEKVQLVGFGTFETRERENTGRVFKKTKGSFKRGFIRKL